MTPYDPSVGWTPEGWCVGCDCYDQVDDIGLCPECSGKLERDMIRQRAWEYSATAYGMTPERCEELRSAVIAEYGEALELIAEKAPPKKKKRRRRQRRRR